jgi:hypothetical protein
VRLRPKNESPDPGAPRPLHRADQQDIRLLSTVLRSNDVALLEVDRIDVVQVDEVLDVDRSAPLGLDGSDLVIHEKNDRPVIAFGASQQVFVRDPLFDFIGLV